MMELLPPELITHIMRFLCISDRKEAALVCKTWYHSSLHPLLQRDLIVKCKPPAKGCLPPVGFVQRKMTHLDLSEWDGLSVSEETLVALLSKFPSLRELSLSRCNNLFLSGRLLEKEDDRNFLTGALANVRELKLGCLRHMTDVTFSRMVGIMKNLEKISLTSTNMIYGSGLYDVNQSSPAMLHFSTFLGYVKNNVQKLRSIDLSYTTVHDEALGSLANIEGLALEEICLQGCLDITDKGLKALVTKQHSLQMIDISGCKEVGNGKLFFSTFANNLPNLHTLILRKCVRVGQCDISSLAHMASLRHLDLGEVLNLYDRELIKGICIQTPRFTTLNLPFVTELQDEFIFQLCKTNCMLTHLDLSSCLKLTDASLHAITRSLLMLRSLKLRYCRELSDIGLLGYVPENGITARHSFDHDHDGCPCNRKKESKIFRKPSGLLAEHKSSISQAQTSLEKGETMYMLSNLAYLQVLDLSSCPRVTELSLAQVVKFRELRVLSLGALPKMEDEAVEVIARSNPSLEEVSLCGNPGISDAAVRELVTHCPRLSHLDVSQCQALTDSSLWIVGSKGRRLRQLDISFCNMAMDVVAALESQLPSLKIIFKPHTY